MNSWWSILIGLVVLTVGGLPDSVLASDRNGMAWQKSTNFNNHQNRQILVKMKRTKPATQVARFSSTKKKPEPPAYRILATFQLDQDALALAPAQEPVAPAKPVPGKCEWVRSIVVGMPLRMSLPRSARAASSPMEHDAEAGATSSRQAPSPANSSRSSARMPCRSQRRLRSRLPISEA